MVSLSVTLFPSSNPITDATSSQLACNDDGTAGALQQTATVAAGTPITAYWNQGTIRPPARYLPKLNSYPQSGPMLTARC
jgi:lytic cellulose monooxygenase (C1-hydroxylating)